MFVEVRRNGRRGEAIHDDWGWPDEMRLFWFEI